MLLTCTIFNVIINSLVEVESTAKLAHGWLNVLLWALRRTRMVLGGLAASRRWKELGKWAEDSARSSTGSGEVRGGSIASAGARVTNWVYIVGSVCVCASMPVQFPACRLTNMRAPALTNPPILFLSAHTMHILVLPMHTLYRARNMQMKYWRNMHASVKKNNKKTVQRFVHRGSKTPMSWPQVWAKLSRNLVFYTSPHGDNRNWYERLMNLSFTDAGGNREKHTQ